MNYYRVEMVPALCGFLSGIVGMPIRNGASIDALVIAASEEEAAERFDTAAAGRGWGCRAGSVECVRDAGDVLGRLVTRDDPALDLPADLAGRADPLFISLDGGAGAPVYLPPSRDDRPLARSGVQGISEVRQTIARRFAEERHPRDRRDANQHREQNVLDQRTRSLIRP